MTNLFDMRFPHCGSEDHIDIAATIWVRLCANGTDADASRNGDRDYSPASSALSAACDFCSTVADFEHAGGHP
jgi:hypothetical protein